jgi:hypothetical protein
VTAGASPNLPKALVITASLLPAIVFVAVYGPAVGHGFISDDFGWIAHSRVESWSALTELRARQHDFYRPLVSLSFAVNYLISGNAASGYGLTNLALALLCAGLVVILLRQLDLPIGAAILGGSLWLLNFHGINMAVLWISGRTALLLVASSIAAAIFVLRRQFMFAAVFMALALLAKEEAVLLPAILAAWLYLLRGNEASRVFVVRMSLWLLLSAVLLSGYFALRAQADALTPATAPYYYKLTFSPATLAGNLLSYIDRAATLPVVAVIAAALTLQPWRTTANRRGVRPQIVLAGLAWLIGGYAITLFLPVRSSLYACFPSVGACVIAAEICGSWWLRSTVRSRRFALLAAIVLTLAAAPLHALRTARWVDLADLSNAVLTSLESATTPLPAGATVVVHDDRSRRANIEAAFGSMLDDAYELKTGRRMQVWIEPPIRDAAVAGLKPPCDGCVDMVLALGRDGRLRVPPPPQR